MMQSASKNTLPPRNRRAARSVLVDSKLPRTGACLAFWRDSSSASGVTVGVYQFRARYAVAVRVVTNWTRRTWDCGVGAPESQHDELLVVASAFKLKTHTKFGELSMCEIPVLPFFTRAFPT